MCGTCGCREHHHHDHLHDHEYWHGHEHHYRHHGEGKVITCLLYTSIFSLTVRTLWAKLLIWKPVSALKTSLSSFALITYGV